VPRPSLCYRLSLPHLELDGFFASATRVFFKSSIPMNPSPSESVIDINWLDLPNHLLSLFLILVHSSFGTNKLRIAESPIVDLECVVNLGITWTLFIEQ